MWFGGFTLVAPTDREQLLAPITTARIYRK